VLEESGLQIWEPKLHGLLMFPAFKGDDWYMFVFTARKFEGELIDSPEGELAWIPDEKLTSLNLWESDQIFFSWLEKEGFFSAKFIYHGDQMQSYAVTFY
jgi:8-oxo-dGTP diphosphatase